MLTDTVTRFRRRVTDVEGVLGSVSRRGAEVGRSLFGSVGRNLEGMAQNLVGVVKEEVDHAFEGRIAEFVDGATREAVRSIAAYLADETHADAFAQMRLGVLDVLMDTTVACLAGEADKVGPEEIVEVLVVAVRASVDQDDFVEQLTEQVRSVMDEAGDGTFGAWLREVELEEVWTGATTELLADRLGAVVATDAFTDWWQRLHAPEAPGGG